MTATYEKIATTTLGSSQATVTLSSIPATYTDLVVIINHVATGTSSISFRFNADSSTNYSRTSISGDGTGTGTFRSSNDTLGYIGTATTSFGNTIIHINNYSNTTTYKTVIGTTYQADNSVIARANLWRSTAAINQISFIGGATYNTNSVFTIYGIKAE